MFESVCERERERLRGEGFQTPTVTPPSGFADVWSQLYNAIQSSCCISATVYRAEDVRRCHGLGTAKAWLSPVEVA